MSLHKKIIKNLNLDGDNVLAPFWEIQLRIKNQFDDISIIKLKLNLKLLPFNPEFFI